LLIHVYKQCKLSDILVTKVSILDKGE
jgi:hypothetical protein